MPNVPSTETAERITPLTRSAVAFHESRNNTWSAVVQPGTTKETTVAIRLVVRGIRYFPRVRPDQRYLGRSFWLRGTVGNRLWTRFCNVILLNYHQLPALLVSEQGLPPGFDIYFDGPINNGEGGYCAKRISDGVLLVKGKPNRDEALKELLDSATLR